MNILLDTHTFLWFVDDNPHLSETARVLIESDDAQPFLSMASLWEIAIKISLGKLQLKQPYEIFTPEQLALNGIGVLNLSMEHTRQSFNMILANWIQTYRLCTLRMDNQLHQLIVIPIICMSVSIGRLR